MLQKTKLCNCLETHFVGKLVFYVSVYGKHETVYFSHWEEARREQNEMACEEIENFYKNIITTMNDKCTIEKRIHLEMERYLKENKDVSFELYLCRIFVFVWHDEFLLKA